MNITFCCPGSTPGPWLAGLRAALPQAQVEVWHSGAARQSPVLSIRCAATEHGGKVI